MVMNINTGDLTTSIFENNIASYQYNDSTLLNFIAANIQIGKKLNIWSSMLGKHSRNANFKEEETPFEALRDLISDA